VIIGAGQVGSYLAERLSLEGQDNDVIDTDAARVKELQDSLDVMVIQGNGATPGLLEKARIGDAEMLIAVTSQDAVNVLACQTATRLGVPLKIARVEDPALRPGLEAVGVDVVIDPEDTLAHEL
jgi:trk system potassium uptake protein TrkA